MLNKEQEKQLRKLRTRFIRLHGEKRWINLSKYSEVVWMTPIKITKLLGLSYNSIYYWLKKLQKITKKWE